MNSNLNLPLFIRLKNKIHAYCENPDVVLVGNKSDMDRARVVTETQARSFAERYNLPYVETSVRTGQNVKKSFDVLLELVMSR